MEFLKSSDLALNAGNYLVNSKGEAVTNAAYVAEQAQAHYIVTLAAKCKGKVFKASAVADFDKLAEEARKETAEAAATVYYEKEAAPKVKVLDELVKAALDFQKVGTKNNRADKLNTMLQGFNTINKVDNAGMYFDKGVVELAKIYTLSDIKAAAEVIVDIEQ